MKQATTFAQNLSKLLGDMPGHFAHEVFLERVEMDKFESILDARSRWSGLIRKTSSDICVVEIWLYLFDSRSSNCKFTVKDDEWNDQDVEKLALKLHHQALKSKKDPSGMPVMVQDIPFSGLEIFDPRRENLTDEDRNDVISLNMNVVSDVSPRAKAKYFRLEESLINREFHSSKIGTHREKSTRFSLYGEVALQTKPPRNMKRSLSSRHFADVASRPISVGLVRLLEKQERTSKPPEVGNLVIFDPLVIAELITAMLPAFESEKINNGESFLADRIGELVASRRVHIIDDASIPNGVQTRSFDNRGRPPLPLTLIREGVMDCQYVCPRRAKVHDILSSGHSGPEGELWPGNIIVKSGRRSLNMIFSDQSVGVRATHLHSPLVFDVKTGDFEMTAYFDLIGNREGGLGLGRVRSNILDFLPKVEETANNQHRIGFIDVSSWVMSDIEVEFL